MNQKKNINRNYWKAEEELIIQQWADKAQCYQWMHNKCRDIYKSKNAWYTIPVIMISTITGTANFAQDRFPEEYKEYVVMGIGTLSIIAGIITTVHQFLKISELNEGHRVAALSWSKFHNNLKTQALRHPLDRMPPNEAIKIFQEEYDRLIEISPDILKSIVKKFNTNFKKNKDLSKPEISNKLDQTQVFQMTKEERDEMVRNMNNIKPPSKKMVNTFFNITGRDPTEDEILNLDNPEKENINLDVHSESNASINSQESNKSSKSKESEIISMSEI